eukprot:TRINITY_DN5248_c0_g1_i1.p1 TRINITY_DN5248_c0_g1~~TRINITY_DN5248_c0_g1_i1.p1  ORF type:complete len:339 (+),score=64.77 TRINITY_DN5248_c0_g1_i1:873-1889(+)
MIELSPRDEMLNTVKYGIALSCVSCFASILALGTMIAKSHVFKVQRTNNKEGIDRRLIWPQLFVAVCAFCFSLLNLVVFAIEFSSSVQPQACGALIWIMEPIFVLGKIGIFFFLVRKAQVVEGAVNAHKSAFWILYLAVLAYAICELGAGYSVKLQHVSDENRVQRCIFEIDLDWIGAAAIVEFGIAVGSFLVFLKPLVTVSRLANTLDVETLRRRQALKQLIVSNLLYGTACLGVSYCLKSYLIYVLGHFLPFAELLFACAVMQLDLIIGLATLMLSTRVVWFDKSSSTMMSSLVTSSQRRIESRSRKPSESGTTANAVESATIMTIPTPKPSFVSE